MRGRISKPSPSESAMSRELGGKADPADEAYRAVVEILVVS
jgi:hypothetical protein